ncbi:tetratricopeptide repeat protein [Piscinibacter sp. HJYY11]|uniref:tetratricopeptide repeat protein n=1 Tax=Piscinibacter sp. HJYY11 TaxID=2801333 RepID=UPI00191CF0FF|nr:tetratricopeptide repeat protein [Piscinibacter sp. HJYY11]MBL0728235.1 tetratricopeptide repeat protein [Piscinibacter sp. HJYY11]
MNLIDPQGHRISNATPPSLDAYERAARELLCMVGDPLAAIDQAIALSPDMTMAHAFKAWVMLLGTEAPALPAARAALDAAATLPADDREQRHLAAARALAHGHWREAALQLEDLSLRYPRDTLALQVGHQLDFFRGDSRMLRDRIARALPAWDAAVPGWHAVLGMHAFGLEECGQYVEAERQGRRSVELEPHDSWGWHAVAHVHEMRHDPRAGIAWLQTTSDTWADGSFLATHNWWHLALFHLELDEHAEVLRLYDRAIGGTGSSVVLDLIDASAMLWRLQLRGVDVGGRWQAIAERWLPHAASGHYAFNDLHAMLAFSNAGMAVAQQQLLEAQRAAMDSDGDNAVFTREVGHPAVLAVKAFTEGDHAKAAALLRGIRPQAHRFGGSHAQRDLIDLTLIEAALRSGDVPLARGLAHERLAQRPRSAWAQRLGQRAQALRLN